jgi:hypothetical protein
MAGEWNNIRVIKPMKIFEVHVGEEFSLYEKTEFKYNSPYMIYSYVELYADYCNWDSKLNLTSLGGDRFVYVPIDEKINYKSIISVIVMESNDAKTIEYNKTGSSTWNTLFKLSKDKLNYYYLKNISNKESIVKNISGSSFIIPKSVPYVYGCNYISFREWFDYNDENSYRYWVECRQKGIVVDDSLKYRHKSFGESETLYVNLSDDCMGFFGEFFIFGQDSSPDPNIMLYLDDEYIGKFNYRSSVGRHKLYIFEDYLLNKKYTTLKIVVSGGIQYHKDIWVIQLNQYIKDEYTHVDTYLENIPMVRAEYDVLKVV